ncbi:MAG: hypothetical protein K2G20_09550, partial [Lachnospiraceae bacterium]|nr:hypothetical protein [Lachnospiraceae bacterium]
MRRHFSRLCGGNVEAAKLLVLFLLTAKGIPFLYQGEEMPLADVRIESSQDLQDAQGRYAYEKMLLLGKTEEEAFGYARERARDYARGLIDWDLQREGSLQELYQSLLTLRREHEALRTGKYGNIAMNGHLFYFERIGRREKIAVTIDFSLTGMISAGYGGNTILLEIKGGNGCMGLVERLV